MRILIELNWWEFSHKKWSDCTHILSKALIRYHSRGLLGILSNKKVVINEEFLFIFRAWLQLNAFLVLACLLACLPAFLPACLLSCLLSQVPFFYSEGFPKTLSCIKLLFSIKSSRHLETLGSCWNQKVPSKLLKSASLCFFSSCHHCVYTLECSLKCLESWAAPLEEMMMSTNIKIKKSFSASKYIFMFISLFSFHTFSEQRAARQNG